MCEKNNDRIIDFCIVSNCSMARYNGRLHCVVGVLPTCYKRKAATYFYPRVAWGPHCKGDQKKTVAISQRFNHVQLHVHWMNLLNTRICRYTCIYITPAVQTLHYCPAGA